VSEAARIADLLRDTMDREPYYGPSVVTALTPVSWNLATAKLQPDGHSPRDIGSLQVAREGDAHHGGQPAPVERVSPG